MNENKIREIQILEEKLQNFLIQKQSFQIELSESEGAMDEIEKSDEVFKIIGGIMLKSDANSVKSELSEKKKVLELRIRTIEKQEELIEKKMDELRSQLVKSS